MSASKAATSNDGIAFIPEAPVSQPVWGAVGLTGLWRTVKPQVNYDKCVKCDICWIYCPETTIRRLPDNSIEIVYEYCKGCGICANECPVDAIDMVEDS